MPQRRPRVHGPGATEAAVKLRGNARSSRRWISTVKTDSTHPPPSLFTRSARQIATTLASKKVSPKGPASGMRMLVYFINRAGKRLSARRRAVLEKAKEMLSHRIHQERERRARR